VFTPSTKAEVGEHDEAIDFASVVSAVGATRASELRELTLALYRQGAEIAASAGIVLADTKFEFGVTPEGGLVLGDEVLTPDSSRFWPAATWSPGSVQPSYDKQYVRDWLTSSGWDRVSPPPELPADVVEATRERYVTAYERLTGQEFA
jgi:phosphoribosylaminoimidazole-succinocarboxamide synthase